MQLRLIGSCLLSLLCLACTIPEGQDFKLGVPYRAQEQFNYCVPASILMWRLYDGLPAISQTTIFNELGGTVCKADKIPGGLSHFTQTLDTFVDVQLSPNEPDIRKIMARQITSVGESRVPVIAVVGAKNHVGIVNGGKYHEDDIGLFVWDYVYFHDPNPARGGNDFYAAADWLNFFCRELDGHCAQVVSRTAIIGWDAHLDNFGNSVTYQGEPAILNQTP